MNTQEETKEEAVAEYSDKQKALALYLNCEAEELTEGYSDDRFEYGNAEYWVMTDEEADQAWDESLDNYIDECVLHELPEQYRQYFDNEKFKQDCRFDGRGHSLSSYDGEENEIKFNDTWYYIYRTN